MKQTRLLQTAAMVLALAAAFSIGAADDASSYIHDPVRMEKKTWVVETAGGTEPIEDMTAFCTDCHSDLETADNQIGHPAGSSVRSHPVDLPYPENGTDLVPLKELNEALLLINGSMACITCHTAEAPDHHLVIPDAFGELCISCHKK